MEFSPIRFMFELMISTPELTIDRILYSTSFTKFKRRYANRPVYCYAPPSEFLVRGRHEVSDAFPKLHDFITRYIMMVEGGRAIPLC